MIKALDTLQDPPLLEDPLWTNEAKDRLEDPSDIDVLK